MSKRFRLILILFSIGACGFFLYPTFKWYFLIPAEKRELALISRQQIRDFAERKASEDLEELETLTRENPGAQIPTEYKFILNKAKENYRLADRPFPDRWTVRKVLASFRNAREALEAIEEHYREEILQLKELSNEALKLGLDLSGGMSVLLEADMESLKDRLGHEPAAEDRRSAIDRAMEILTNRIDKFGVSEPSIRRQGTDQISIQIPGEADPERIRTFLRGKGRLTFHLVDDDATAKLQEYIKENPREFAGGNITRPDFLDAGDVIRGFYQKDKYGIDQRIRYIVIEEEVALDGNHIQDAQVGSHPITGQPVINFTLDRGGGEIFFKVTSANVGRTLAIVLDDKVKAGARISEPIRESVQMTGFDRQEATDLALVLRTAALPVDLIINSQQAIGASLGEDAIRMGIRAILLGFLLVIVFMLFYYKMSGLIADLALVLNLFIMVSILTAFNLTLTLTGIAGIILTVGMAVDANVIIFERIKEEYKIGKSPEASVKAGFRKAFWTIMDSNITTFIAAIFLSQLGTGPIQGFAYTLAVGILTSMFTALVVSRLVFDFLVESVKVSRLSIGWRVR
ncbi:MAG: protein translocase subunit SecD [Spirochaetes bacterium]|nr:MAG: protein translocase subunit SecD [Spirochaetota bacterium]